MSVDAMIATLKALRLYGMAQSIEELAEQAAPAYQQAEPILNDPLKAEVADREVRSINYQMKMDAGIVSRRHGRILQLVLFRFGLGYYDDESATKRGSFLDPRRSKNFGRRRPKGNGT